ncbi:hypothetical protein PYCC9005_003911 [Savitreella phatthalungensis]
MTAIYGRAARAVSSSVSLAGLEESARLIASSPECHGGSTMICGSDRAIEYVVSYLGTRRRFPHPRTHRIRTLIAHGLPRQGTFGAGNGQVACAVTSDVNLAGLNDMLIFGYMPAHMSWQ